MLRLSDEFKTASKAVGRGKRDGMPSNRRRGLRRWPSLWFAFRSSEVV